MQLRHLLSGRVKQTVWSPLFVAGSRGFARPQGSTAVCLLVYRPFVGWAVIAALAAPVLEFEGNLSIRKKL